jgi:hypothetical protein
MQNSVEPRVVQRRRGELAASWGDQGRECARPALPLTVVATGRLQVARGVLEDVREWIQVRQTSHILCFHVMYVLAQSLSRERTVISFAVNRTRRGLARGDKEWLSK